MIVFFLLQNLMVVTVTATGSTWRYRLGRGPRAAPALHAFRRVVIIVIVIRPTGRCMYIRWGRSSTRWHAPHPPATTKVMWVKTEKNHRSTKTAPGLQNYRHQIGDPRRSHTSSGRPSLHCCRSHPRRWCSGHHREISAVRCGATLGTVGTAISLLVAYAVHMSLFDAMNSPATRRDGRISAIEE